MLSKYQISKITNILIKIYYSILSPKKIYKHLINPSNTFSILIEPFKDVKLRKVSINERLRQNYSALAALSELTYINNEKTSIDYFIKDNFISANQNEKNLKILKNLFDINGSDKASVHEYYLIYQQILDELKNRTENSAEIYIMEIGLGTNNIDVPSNMGREGKPGASLRAFSSYIPNCKVHGADIDRRILFKEENIETFFVDQLNKHTLDILFHSENKYDLIIDDGLHTPEANLNTLFFSIRSVKNGGYIVIEDISNDEISLNYWNIVKKILNDKFECEIIDCKSALMFIAKSKYLRG